MEQHAHWIPSFAWHAKTFAWGLIVCLAALGILWYITNHLPAPYQRYTPVTPAQWEQALSQEENK